jgi:hypothetical protein
MTARFRGWFQFEHSAIDLAIHFLTAALFDERLNAVGHEHERIDVPDVAGFCGEKYPNSKVLSTNYAESKISIEIQPDRLASTGGNIEAR